ncbi:MAG: tetratricopeptide repeat protein, partial [Bacteroidales bacterium]|nr:tetratricopeptide repeat protein [Bacteroidales bacterium]
YYELNNVKEAISCYEKAAKMDDNEITAPYALFKAGMGYMQLGDNAKANEVFTKIKEQYPASTEARQIDKYIGATEGAEV